MRINSTILILLFTNVAIGQSYKGLLSRPFNWENWKFTIDDSTKYQTIKNLDHWLMSGYYSQQHTDLREDMDKFRFVDLDLDGSHEIFYEGFIGGEPTGTIIFKRNLLGKFEEIFERMGVIKSLWRNTIDGPLLMETLLRPCCMGTTYTKETWAYLNSDFDLLEKVNWIIGTTIPEELGNPVKFKVLNDPYTLRSSPEIKEDNILTAYKTGDFGYALAERVDETGRVWWFVFMLNNRFPSDKTFYDYAYEDHYYSIGWMSSRYVEITTSQ